VLGLHPKNDRVRNKLIALSKSAPLHDVIRLPRSGARALLKSVSRKINFLAAILEINPGTIITD
jgi:hypothetical protein